MRRRWLFPLQGPNLLKLARKEQCLALLTQLRTKFKIDGYIYRVFPNGEVQYLHPKVREAGGGEGRGRGWACVALHAQLTVLMLVLAAHEAPSKGSWRPFQHSCR